MEHGFDKWNYHVLLKDAEARRDYNKGIMMDIKHLIQLDHKPYRDLTEAKWEIYKISISFEFQGFLIFLDILKTLSSLNKMNKLRSLKWLL